MKTKFIILAGVAAAFTLPAVAAGGGEPGRGKAGAPATRTEVEARIASHFAQLDTNKDGSVTKDEANAAHQARLAERRDAQFKALDSNGDRSISRAEFDARQAGRDDGGPDRMAMKGKRGERGAHWRGRHGRGGLGRGGLDRGGLGMGLLDRADANQDGKLTLAEALARPLQRFDQSDTNKDGTLTPEERKAAREGRRDK